MLTLPTLPHPTTKAILHIDGDSFFAACEQARNPELCGKPVITGGERGIAASMSVEAKRMGVTRAMPLWEIKKICPGAIVLPSDYETYSLLSRRLYDIVRRYTPSVDEYGIDECFADITGWGTPRGLTNLQVAEAIREDLHIELGCTFSVGLAPNKVLAKVGSKWKKPYGLTEITVETAPVFLKELFVDKIWGIGNRTAPVLTQKGYSTALDFAQANEEWVRQNFARPIYDIWQELNGRTVLALELGRRQAPQSVQKFKTFTPPSTNYRFVFAQLVKNIENACIKLRRYNEAARRLVVVLRTQEFRHHVREVVLPHATNVPPEIIPAVEKTFAQLFRSTTRYRATGVTFFDLVPTTYQLDLFKETERSEKLGKLYQAADKVAAKFGKHTLFLGAGFAAHKNGAHTGRRGRQVQRAMELLPGETKRQRLRIPMLMGPVV